MDLRQIQYVEAVARLANFTRAAAELHVAQPALSAAIRRLEAELGVRLFDRTSRRVAITDAGAAFLTHARRIVSDVNGLKMEMRDFAGGLRGRVRLSTWYHVEPDIADHLKAFLDDVPLAEVSIVELPTPAALDALRAGEVDIAMVLLGDADLRGVEHTLVRTEPYVLVTPSDHALSMRDSATVAETLGEPFIVMRPGTAMRSFFERVFAPLDARPRIAIETNELAAMITFVSVGLGCAVATRSIAEPINVPVALVPLADVPEFVLGVAWTPGRHSSVVQAAIESVVARHPQRSR